MRKIVMFTYSIVAYLIAFGSILFWIASVGNLIPEIGIDQEPKMSVIWALMNNFLLIALFGVQHSIMARKWFKSLFYRYFPKPIERSTFVLISGILLFNLVYNWQPIGGQLWAIAPDSIWYTLIYVLFFVGWAILFISSFLINHFDLFGLRQTFLELMGKPYTQLQFRITLFYDYVRHPLYFGMLLGMWATPTMTVTHLVFAIAITAYVIIGTLFEEKDLVDEFGDTYKAYQAKKPMLVPFTKFKKGTARKSTLPKGV
ncbi:isoprenylcysteine carboxylmethyltransferase family protein [Flagellimonas sp. DF-77]|uniref:methyltransferase family protein n=1 Tax=Flagellimonas algarum TaxID=3230298 RepID=UPI00339B69DE